MNYASAFLDSVIMLFVIWAISVPPEISGGPGDSVFKDNGDRC